MRRRSSRSGDDRYEVLEMMNGIPRSGLQQEATVGTLTTRGVGIVDRRLPAARISDK